MAPSQWGTCATAPASPKAVTRREREADMSSLISLQFAHAERIYLCAMWGDAAVVIVLR